MKRQNVIDAIVLYIVPLKMMECCKILCNGSLQASDGDLALQVSMSGRKLGAVY